MESIYTLLAVLAGIAFIAMIVGLIRPELVVRWGEKRTRGRVLLYYGVGAIVLSFLSDTVMPDEVREKQEQARLERERQEEQARLKPARENLERGTRLFSVARAAYESQDYQTAIDSAGEATHALEKAKSDINEAVVLASQAQAFLDSAKAAVKKEQEQKRLEQKRKEAVAKKEREQKRLEQKRKEAVAKKEREQKRLEQKRKEAVAKKEREEAASALIKEPPRPKGIGVSRHAIQSIFEKPELGFTFDSSHLEDGRPRVTGSSELALIELIGPPEDISSAYMMVFLPNDSPNEVTTNLLRLGAFMSHAVPTWKEGVSWLTDNLKRVIAQEEVQTTHGHLVITLKHYSSMGNITLKIAVQEE